MKSPGNWASLTPMTFRRSRTLGWNGRITAMAGFAALALLLLVPLAQAGGFETFQARYVKAQALARASLAGLRAGRAQEAENNLKRLLEAWTALANDYRAGAPAPYSRALHFSGTLEGTLARVTRAVSAQADGNLDAAIGELMPLRRDWVLLRREAGLYGLSECLDEASDALDAFLALRRPAPDLARGEVRGEITAKAAVYRYALGRCEAFAAADAIVDGDYRRMTEGINAALDVVGTAVRLRDGALIDRVLGELKSLDAQLVLRFG